MRRVLLISLSLVLALAGGSMVGADDSFYVIPGLRGQYAPPPKTGQTTSYGTRDDGALQKGVAWPTPRFTDNNNGTVTDNLTRLIWTKNANVLGQITWDQAISGANGLKSGDAGLTDGSQPGDWRLPNPREFQSLADYSRYGPALPASHPFTNVQTLYYWSSTTAANDTTKAWEFIPGSGYATIIPKNYINYVWCVRGGL